LNPEESRALVAKTNILAAKNDPEQLKNVIGSMQAADPDSPEGYFRMGRVHRTLGELEAAHAEYEKALARAEGQGAVLMLGEMVSLEIQMERLDAAEARVRAALKADPEHPTGHGLLATIRMAQQRFADAEREYLAQIERSPDAAQPYARLAATRLAQNDMDGAVEAYQMGLERQPGSPSLLIPLAGVQERRGNYDRAIELYEQVLASNPDNAIATNNLAALLSDHRTDQASLDRALELAEKFRNADQAVFLDTLGWVYYRRGEYAQAVKVLRRAVEQSPDIAIFHYHLGMAHHGAGDAAQARKHLQRAVDAGGDFAGIEEARKVLEGL
ncbi:MAG TPA: tetratricopeptide repeat protein, partial [Thiohalobacter sp.]|nr:tetratricopeptide repeat protein [Thiohalobacter sp.]